MKVYIHTGQGHYVGSCIVVIAKDAVDAMDMIRAELDTRGLRNEELNIEEFKTNKAQIIHSDNGDY